MSFLINLSKYLLKLKFVSLNAVLIFFMYVLHLCFRSSNAVMNQSSKQNFHYNHILKLFISDIMNWSKSNCTRPATNNTQTIKSSIKLCQTNNKIRFHIISNFLNGSFLGTCLYLCLVFPCHQRKNVLDGFY